MITRCNRCGAKFEISVNLVRSSDPTVRCGECLSVFDASEHLIPDDSIHNYVTEPAPNRRRTDKRREVAGSVVNRAPVVSHATDTATAESMAHITADDLENASTLAFEHGALDSEETGVPAAADRARPVSTTRVNDGFYSPDLDINQFESSPSDQQFKSPHHQPPSDRQSVKHDPMIDLGESLDNTSLEFERTLALENFTDAESPQYSADSTTPPSADVTRSPDISEFSQPIVNDFRPEPRTNITYDETVRFEQTDDFSAQSFAESRQAGVDDHAERNPERSTSEYTDTTINTGRDYPLLSDDFLDQNATVNEAQDAFSQSQNQPESLYSDDRQYSSANSDQRNSDVDELEEDLRERRVDQDSARELRRYVSSRGGAVYPEGSARNRQGTRSSILPVLLMCVALGGVLYLARNVIATMNLPEPVVSAFCAVTGCELPAKKDIEQLELVRHQMFSHKTLDDVLVFSVDLVNRARFPQPYPVLVVTMANGTGESVAFRKFEPAEYLEDDPALKTLPAGEPVRIKFEIVDPGPQALSSELSFE